MVNEAKETIVGEVAEMMLDGTLCEGCGVYLGATEMDCPCLCDDCAKDRKDDGMLVERVGKVWVDAGPEFPKKAKKIRCPKCSRMVKATGINDHNRVMHSATPNVAVDS